jgi:hypothetical protein
MSLESSVRDATIWSVILESPIMILEASFDYSKMFIAKATYVATGTRRGNVFNRFCKTVAFTTKM